MQVTPINVNNFVNKKHNSPPSFGTKVKAIDIIRVGTRRFIVGENDDLFSVCDALTDTVNFPKDISTVLEPCISELNRRYPFLNELRDIIHSMLKNGCSLNSIEKFMNDQVYKLGGEIIDLEPIKSSNTKSKYQDQVNFYLRALRTLVLSANGQFDISKLNKKLHFLVSNESADPHFDQINIAISPKVEEIPIPERVELSELPELFTKPKKYYGDN